MIERLRRGAQSGLSYILIGVLIVFFAVFFGVPADGCMAGDGQRSLMASVDGDNVYTEDVNIIQNRYFAEDRRGTRTRDEQFYSQQAEALRIVIATHLLAQRAEEAGLRVSDEEFRDYITDANRNIEFMSAYGRTGEFDGPFYERYVRHGLRVPLQSYEDFKRKELLARKYMSILDMQAHTTPDEIKELHELRNTRVNLEYVRFDEDALVDVIGLDDDNIDEFLADDANLERIEEYFEEHRQDYEEPERVRLRTVRIFGDFTGIEDTELDDLDLDAEAQRAAEDYREARQRIIDDGEDFATVASELSQDLHAEDGGLMEWRELDNIPEDYPPAIEDIDVGDVVTVETAHALDVLKLEDREEQQVEDLEDVQREIAEILLRRDIVETRGVELAETLLERLDGETTLEQALEALREEAEEDEREEDAELWAALRADTTGFFNLDDEQPEMGGQQFGAQFSRPWDEIPGIGEARDLAIESFELTEDSPVLDRIVELDDSRLVIRLEEREEPDELFSVDERELRFEARNTKVMELLGPWEQFFTQPVEGFGHYIESIYSEAMADGSIRLYERNSPAAAHLRQLQEDEQAAIEDVVEIEEQQFPGEQELEGEFDDDDAPGGPPQE